MGFLKGLVFFAVAQMGCGLFLALVFGLGHNGMSTYAADARPDFWKLQVSGRVGDLVGRCVFLMETLRWDPLLFSKASANAG